MDCDKCKEKDELIVLLKSHIKRLQAEILIYKQSANRDYYMSRDYLPYFDQDQDG